MVAYNNFSSKQKRTFGVGVGRRDAINTIAKTVDILEHMLYTEMWGCFLSLIRKLHNKS
jgi:hypothetical protein